MIEEKLESLKKEYLKTKTPHYLVNYGWSNLESKLGQSKSTRLSFIGPRNIAFASLVLIIIFVSTIAISQRAKPGDNLYPVKIASDKVTTKVTGNYEAIIEKRAQEVIETSDNGQSFEEASKQYQQTIDEAKDKVESADEEKKEDLRKKLEEQERRFQEAQKESQKSKKNRLEQIQERTRQTRGEVKGEKDKKQQEESNREKEENKNDGKNDEEDNNKDED